MNVCLELANKSFLENEVPVGSVIVKDEKIIGHGRNLVNSTRCPTDHAEIIAISEASRYLKNWRLIDCDIYVTLEPCMMCVGAINNSRIRRIIYGAKNNNFGAIEYIKKGIDIVPSILEEKSSEILRKFFCNIRNTC